jgi:superfamily I DNA and RNA helicase
MINSRICDGLDERFPIEVAVWFSSCDIADKIDGFPLAYTEAKGAILGHEAFKEGPQSIYNIFDYYSSRNKVNVTDEEFDKIVELIASDFELITAPGARKDELDHAFLKLTNEQTGLLDYISEQRSATIQGVAGTGKTLIAKEAARRFGLEGRKVLFMCFNKFLYAYLKHQYPYENVTYYNIHSLITSLGDSVGDISKPKERAAALIRIDWDKLDFDDVIVDEAQDFLNDEIIYFKELSELREGHFFAFYDKNQLLTTEEVPVWIKDSECKLLLTKNCRNTYEIALTAYNVIDVELNQKIVMINGQDTAISFVKGDPISKLNILINYLTNDQHGYGYSDITILSMKTEGESILNGINKISGIPIMRERSNSGVFFTTSKKFKGLENRAIIVIDIDETCFSTENIKRNFYVACSRATHFLSLFINGDDDKIKQIADAISRNSHFAPKGRIAMKTKGKIMHL